MKPDTCCLPLRSLALVIRQQQRRRRFRYDALWALAAAVLLAAAAWAMRSQLLSSPYNPGDAASTVLLRMLVCTTTASALFLPLFAALLAPAALPLQEEKRTVEEQIMAGIGMSQILGARLLAALRPILLLWLLLVLLWGGFQLYWHIAPSLQALLFSQFQLLCGISAASCTALLCAASGKGKRHWGRGSSMAAAVHLLLCTGLLLAEQKISQSSNPVRLIEGLLAVNPVMAACSPLQFDLLRTPWLYLHSSAAEFEFHTPPAALFALGAAVLSALSLFAASIFLQRAWLRSA